MVSASSQLPSPSVLKPNLHLTGTEIQLFCKNKFLFLHFFFALQLRTNSILVETVKERGRRKVRVILTGLRVVCSLKLSSRKADCVLESLSFFLVVPFSSSSLSPSQNFLLFLQKSI